MEITKLEKEVLMDELRVRLTVEITIDMAEVNSDYKGLDLLSDEKIPDILVAIGRQYSNRIKKGKIRKHAIS